MARLHPEVVGQLTDGEPAHTDRPWVYIAGPYTLGDVVVNVRNACAAGDRIWDAGFMPIVPHTNYAWHMAYPKTPEHWYAYDLHLLAQCDHLVLLPGTSKGADREAVFAIKRRIPCYLGVEHFLASVTAVRRGWSMLAVRNPP